MARRGVHADQFPKAQRRGYELESVVERAVISSPGPALRLGDESKRRAGPTAEAASPGGAALNVSCTLTAVERDHIVAILEI